MGGASVPPTIIMALYQYECVECGDSFDVMKLIAESDREEKCPACDGDSKRIYTPTPCHGLSDGPGTRTPNKPHKPIFDLVDVHNDSQYTYNKLKESGKLDSNPEMKREMEVSMQALRNRPRDIIDYQKTGHPCEK